MMTDRRREFWSRYEIPRSGAQLGSGRYGSVYRAIDHVSGDLVAIKKVTMEVPLHQTPHFEPSSSRTSIVESRLRLYAR